MPALVIWLIVMSIAMAACFGKKTETPQVSRAVNPRIVTEFEVQGWVWTDDPSNVISPDGKEVLLILNNEERKAVAVAPVEGETHEVRILHEAPAGWVELDGLDYRTLGWTKDGTPLFVVFGYQNRGPNVGKRGVAIWAGGSGEKPAEELAFIDLPRGNFHSSTYIPGQDKVFISVSTAIYSYDLRRGKVSEVRTGLPTYDGLFYANLSPDGRYFVYELYDEDKMGVYILDAETGKEEALLPAGPTFSFVPQWSPDGKYVAVYTADRKPGASGTSLEVYDCFLGTAGPLPVASAITVVDTSGRVVQEIRVEGKYLANMRWAPDSRAIAFVTGDKLSAAENPYDEMGIPDIKWDGVFIARTDARSAPLQVASLDTSAASGMSFVYPCDFDVSSEGVFYQYGDMEMNSVWYAAPGRAGESGSGPSPVEIARGYWHLQYANPKFGEYLGALISGDETTELWFLGPERLKAGGWDAASVRLLAFDEDTILLFCKEEALPAKVLVISVYE